MRSAIFASGSPRQYRRLPSRAYARPGGDFTSGSATAQRWPLIAAAIPVLVLASPSPARTLGMRWDHFRRLRDLDTPVPRPRSFASYGTQAYGFRHPGELVAHGTRRVTAYLRRSMRRPRSSPGR